MRRSHIGPRGAPAGVASRRASAERCAVTSLTSPRSLLACRLQSLSRQALPLPLRRGSATQACNVLSADSRKCGQYRPIRRNARLARGIPGRLGNRIRYIHRLKRRSKGSTWPMLWKKIASARLRRDFAPEGEASAIRSLLKHKTPVATSALGAPKNRRGCSASHACLRVAAQC
jgi:hypothetical protein